MKKTLNFKKKNIPQGIIEINQTDMLSPKIQTTQESIGILLRQKFQELTSRTRMKVTKTALSNLYGRHNAVDYKQQYDFHENWQEVKSKTSEESAYSILKNESWMFNLLYLTIFVFYGVSIWFLTIYRLFGMNNQLYNYFIMGIFIQILDVLMKYFFFKKLSRNIETKIKLKIKQALDICGINILFCGYLFYLIIFDKDGVGNQQILMLPDLFFIYKGYQRFTKLYQIIKIRILTSSIRYQAQVIQLIISCLFKVHLLVFYALFQSLVIYLVSKIDQNNNWTISIDNFNNSWLTKYIYSLYFTCTTMFTVGYGDITPKNLYEIISILFVQVFGIINIGYIINEVGRFLSKINEKQQILFKNISQAQLIATNLKLPNDLSSKMRNHIIQNTIKSYQMNIQQEEQFMQKLNEQLREDVKLYNQLNIIKSSIFFLCHWSIKFQQKVAEKLVKSIYSPQQRLPQICGKQKIYILARGQIDLQVYQQFNSIECLKKVVRTIKINPHAEVQQNIYGYTNLISGLKMRTRGIVKQYTICFTLTKDDIISIISENQRDFGYFHVIKSRIESSKIKQKFQAPEINNIRQHYDPYPFYVIKRRKHECMAKQNRRHKCRQKKREKLMMQSDFHRSSTGMLSFQQQVSEQQVNSEELNQLINLPTEQKIKKFQTLIKMQGYPFATNNLYKKSSLKASSRSIRSQKVLQLKKKQCLNIFQSLKAYQTYYTKYNHNEVINNYNTCYHKKDKKKTLPDINSRADSTLFDAIKIDVFGRFLKCKKENLGQKV